MHKVTHSNIKAKNNNLKNTKKLSTEIILRCTPCNCNVIILFLFSELYEYCLKENIADKNLIAKWKKQGYENLCCLRCIQVRDTNFGTNCICRVPKSKLEAVCTFFDDVYIVLFT